MKNFHKISCFFAVFSLLNGCVSSPQPDNKTQDTPAQSSVQIEPQKGRLNVETSVARALKYNHENIKKQITPKFLGQEARENAFANLRKLKEGQTAGLPVSLKELDFAIIYASANYMKHPDLRDNVINQAVSQNITLAAINAHKNVLFANRKTFEIQRKIRQYQKQIANILKKKNTSDNDDLAYKNKLEDNINRLKALQQTLEQNDADFRHLVKIEAKKIETEGARFFENTVLPPQSESTPYIETALNGRFELVNFPQISFEEIDRKITEQYPDNSAAVKGFYVQDSAYQQNLSARGDAQASVLLQTILDYQKANKTKKEKILPKLSEELHKAIYLQVETAYQLAAKTSADYQGQLLNIKEMKKELRQLEKVSRPTIKQRLDILDAQITLMENEFLADQILAERTLALKALQFYTAQIYISPEDLKKNVSQISAALSQKFKKNLTSHSKTKTLSLFSNDDEDAISMLDTPNSWAHKDNWLEKLMEDSKRPHVEPKKIMSKPISERGKHDLKKTMQIGTFLDKESAAAEWIKISSKFPELTKYQPLYEPTSAAGISLFRLVVKSARGGFKDLCIKLRQSGHECTLRD